MRGTSKKKKETQSTSTNTQKILEQNNLENYMSRISENSKITD